MYKLSFIEKQQKKTRRWKGRGTQGEEIEEKKRRNNKKKFTYIGFFLKRLEVKKSVWVL